MRRRGRRPCRRRAHSRNSTMLDRCLLLPDNNSLPQLQQPEQLAHSHNHTHTHTAQNHMEKEYLTNGRNCWIDTTRRRRLGTASPWSLKRKFTDLKDSVLDLSKRFWYCPNSSAIRLYSQMWVAYNTTSAEIWQPENNGTEASRLKHSSQFVRGSFTRAASWHTQKNWIWRVVR